MKKLILIPILLFSLFLFSQEITGVEDTQLEKENKSLKIKIDSLQKDINVQTSGLVLLDYKILGSESKES